jgi:hypothetical protein
MRRKAVSKVYAINMKFTVSMISETRPNLGRGVIEFSSRTQPYVTKIGPKSSPRGHSQQLSLRLR